MKRVEAATSGGKSPQGSAPVGDSISSTAGREVVQASVLISSKISPEIGANVGATSLPVVWRQCWQVES